MRQAAKSQTLLSFRGVRPGPEAALVSGFLEKSSGETNHLQRVVLREPELPTGAPDVVAIYCRPNPCGIRLENIPAFTQHHIRIIFHLHSLGDSTEKEIATDLLYAPSRVAELLGDLKAAGFVCDRRDRVGLSNSELLFPVQKIVAVEAKVKDWRKAIEQAAANWWFASHSYILLPRRADFTAIVQEARQHGVGILVSDGKSVRCVLKSTRKNIPASYGSWLVGLWALSNLQ